MPGIWRSIQNDGRNPATGREIGGKERVSILQLAEFIGAKSGKPVRKGAGESTKQGGAPPVEWLDTEKYETEFGAKAFVPFEEGVLRTMHWCMQTVK